MPKPTVPQQRLARWLADRLGAPPLELRPVTAEGEESQAFAFADPRDGERRIVRIGGEGAGSGFRKEAWAQRRFGRAALPIPELLDLAPLDETHWACVSRFVAGTTLQDADEATLHGLVDRVRETLAAIAASDLGGTTGWGPLEPAGGSGGGTLGGQPLGSVGVRGAHASWSAFLRAPLATGWRGGARERPAVEALLAALGELADGCGDVERRLVHGDFGSNNVLTDGERIVAVLDWDCALAGDPLYDAANVFFWAPWLACMRIQAARLDATLPHERSVRRRLRCYQLHIGVRELQELADADPNGELPDVLTRTLRLLDG